MRPKEMATRAKLAIRDPLQSVAAHTEECQSSKEKIADMADVHS